MAQQDKLRERIADAAFLTVNGASMDAVMKVVQAELTAERNRLLEEIANEYRQLDRNLYSPEFREGYHSAVRDLKLINAERRDT